VPLQEVKEAESALQKGEHPMTIKKELAFQIVEELCGLTEAEKAKEAFQKRVQDKEFSETDITELLIKDNMTASETLIEGGFADSKSKAKQLIAQGGVLLDDEKITDPNAKIKTGILKIGKRRVVRIVLK
jgi:tyrosyl-tRNA synthetase